MNFKNLNPDSTKILFKEMTYCKYREENVKGEVTWRCPQCKFVTLKTKEQLVSESPRESPNLNNIFLIRN